MAKHSQTDTAKLLRLHASNKEPMNKRQPVQTTQCSRWLPMRMQKCKLKARSKRAKPLPLLPAPHAPVCSRGALHPGPTPLPPKPLQQHAQRQR
jgi:hypothetical protein